MSSIQAGDVLADRYRLAGRIAGGGMGEVWRGVDLVLDRPVAVKLMRAEYAEHPETLARFRAEARHAAAVSHPAIAQIYDFAPDRPGQPPFLVMELVDGPPLTAVLAAGPLDPARTLDVIAQVAAGLGAAHAAGLVHRDIKPGNLLIGADGLVKITDFGIAHAAGSAPLTRTGAVIGTPAYLAPERLAGASAKPASDLYSLGIVAHECLTGVPPFTGTAVEIALAHTQQELPPLPSAVPMPVVTLIADLTARDVADRPGSAGEVAARAARLRDAMTASRVAAGPGQVPSQWPLRDGSADGPLPGLLGEPAAGLASGSGDPSPTMAGLGGQTLSDVRAAPGGVGTGERSWARRRRDELRLASVRRVAVPAVIALLVIAGLVGWMVAGGGGTALRRHTPAASRPVTDAAGRRVQVDSAALLGQPVGAVVSRLHQLGLRVRVVWEHGGGHARGTVLAVRPAGSVVVGTLIVVVGQRVPPGHDHGHGHGKDGGGDGGGH
jgi:serine/threonine-protein kinase